MYIISQAPAAAATAISTAAASTATFAVAAGEPGAGNIAAVAMPGSNKLNGQPFVVRAAGYFSITGTLTLATSGATPVQLVLNSQLATTATVSVANATAMASLTAIAAYTQAAATVAASAPVIMPWAISVQFIGGPGSSLQSYNLGGSMANPNLLNLVTVPALGTAALASFNPLTEPAALFFPSIVIASSANTGGAVLSANLTSLVLEA